MLKELMSKGVFALPTLGGQKSNRIDTRRSALSKLWNFPFASAQRARIGAQQGLADNGAGDLVSEVRPMIHQPDASAEVGFRKLTHRTLPSNQRERCGRFSDLRMRRLATATPASLRPSRK